MKPPHSHNLPARTRKRLFRPSGYHLYSRGMCIDRLFGFVFVSLFFIFSPLRFSLALKITNVIIYIYLNILALVMLVHIALPELRNKPGRNLFGLAFSLKMAFIILVTIRVGLVPMGTTECFAAGRFLTGL